jgi:hypothetical protein
LMIIRRVLGSKAPPYADIRTFRDEVPHIRHQHIAPEARYQRLLAILAAARTVVTSQPHHAVRPFGERWRAGDHSAATSRQRRSSLSEYIALSDQAIRGIIVFLRLRQQENFGRAI